MPLFGPRAPQAPQAGQPGPLMGDPSSTAAVAEQTGATASSPFLQYLQQNAPAAKQTAQALMGEKPEADYTAALLQAGLGILSQPGGQSPLQAIAKGAQSAVPLFMKERDKVSGYEDRVNQLATKLNISAAEVDSKTKDDNPFVEFNGNVYEKDKLYDLVDEGKTSEEDLDKALVIPKKYAPEQTSEALAKTEQELIRLQGRPDLTEKQKEKLKFLETKISGLKAQIYPQKTSGPGTATIVTKDGRVVTVSADSSELAGSIKQFGDQEQATKIQESQQSTVDAAGYTGRIFELLQTAPPGSTGRLGGLASQTAAWGDMLTGNMQGPVKEQFTTEVQGRPMEKLDEMMEDPEARAWLEDGLYDKLRDIGKRDTQLLSNVIGLGFATATSAEEGGRLSDADVARHMSRLGYDLDAWLNDPASVRAGLLDTLRSNVSQHLTKLMLTAEDPEQAKKLLETDLVTNTVLPQMGFEWQGGIDGELVYKTKGNRGGDESQQGPGGQGEPAPGPSPEPQGQGQGGPRKPISQMTLEDLTSVDQSQMTEEELREAARRYNELTQGAQ